MEPPEETKSTSPSQTGSSASAPVTETRKSEENKSLRGLDTNFDLLKQTMADLLVENGVPAPKEISELTEKLGCSEPTIRKWIKKLESSGFVEKKKAVKGRGRPKTIYHPTSALLNVTQEWAVAPALKPKEPEPALEKALPPEAPEVGPEEPKAPAPFQPPAPEAQAVPPEEAEIVPEKPPVEAPPPEPVQKPALEPKPPETSESLEEEDELLAELAQKVQAPLEEAPRAEKLETPVVEPTSKVVTEAIVEAPAPEAVPEAMEAPPETIEPDEAFKSLLTTVDETLKELEEKFVEIEKTRAPHEYYEYCTFEPPPGFQELERYWIAKPFVWASILYSPERNERLYYLVEPSLTPGEKTALEMLHDHLLDRLTYDERVKDRDRMISMKVNELLREYGVSLTAKSIKKLIYYLKRNYLGYGKIDGMIHDPTIEDISCDGLNVPLFVYSRRYQSIRTNLSFTDANELDLFVIRLVERAGKQITLGKPTVDAALPEGYRLQATLGTEVTTRGSSFSIRKFAEEPFTPVDLLAYGTFSSEMLAYLWLATENKKNIIIVGGTASGKTSTLNALSMFIWPDAKIISIEDTRELALYQENWVPSITRPAPGERSIDMYDLLRQALRQRPEVIVVGEVRGKEALTMFQSMSTGHTCYSTMHAGSIQEMVHRLEGEPIKIPHHMLSALDIVCLQLLTYYRDQRVRRNQSIVEIVGIDPGTGALRTNRVFERNPLTDQFERVGESRVLREIAKERGWSALELDRELRRRQQILEYIYKNNIRRLHEVAAIIRQYHFDPEKVMEQMVAGKLGV
jgi:flagellar protein FlaI